MSQPLPQGSTVLVTGANGLIGSHIIDQILKLGYNVRGSVRDTQKNAWLQKLFEDKYGAGKFSLVQVSDFTQPGCFEKAVQGVDGVAHVASDLSFGSDPNKIITPMIQGVKHVLDAAAKEPKVKSFVLTSSSTAATAPKPNVKFNIDSSTWNEEDVKLAWKEGWDEKDMRHKWAVYGASKTQGEQALWQFAKERKPHFAVNSVLPNANFGPILDTKHQQGSTAGWTTGILMGKAQYFSETIPPQYYIHVQDTAKLHAAVVTDTKYNGERLFAFAEPFNWNDIIKLVHKYAPKDKAEKVPEKVNNDSRDLSTVDTTSAIKVLKEKYAQNAFVPLDEAIKENVESSIRSLTDFPHEW